MREFFTIPFYKLTAGQQLLTYVIRILIALFCGAAIGLERTKRFKEAGLRTHCLVACAACALMILSKYGFQDLISPDSGLAGIRGTDPARIAAQIVSGVSFLGGAVIFKQGNSVHGLTTAAGIWATASIGMLIGAGMYSLGLFVTAVSVTLLLVLHRMNVGNDAYTMAELRAEIEDTPEARAVIDRLLARHNATVLNAEVKRQEDGRLLMVLSMRLREDISYREVLEVLEERKDVYALSV